MRITFFATIISFGFLTGCMESPYQKTVDDYLAAYKQVSIGMTMDEIGVILEPSQKRLSSTDSKRPDKFKKGNKSVDIVYYRTGWNSDGITTDDEFTPYIFENGKLVAMGWQTLGGAKSQGQATSSSYTYVDVTTY